jgi:protein-S-isoprenylcysteine O-methyltransferase Ste14
MREFLSQGLFLVIIQAIICFCVFSLFLAVFIDFALYSRKDKVVREKKSIVETGTMTLFFLVFFVILQSGKGVIAIEMNGLTGLAMILGTMMIAAGTMANVYGRLNLGKNWANQIKIYEEHTFVRTGMYKIVRHPLYASIILMFYGACLVYRNIIAFIAVSVIFVPFMVYRARQEENLLVQRFPLYREYMRNTGMLFPKIVKGKGHI